MSSGLAILGLITSWHSKIWQKEGFIALIRSVSGGLSISHFSASLIFYSNWNLMQKNNKNSNNNNNNSNNNNNNNSNAF